MDQTAPCSLRPASTCKIVKLGFRLRPGSIRGILHQRLSKAQLQEKRCLKAAADRGLCLHPVRESPGSAVVSWSDLTPCAMEAEEGEENPLPFLDDAPPANAVAPFVPTPRSILLAAFERARLSPADCVVDLGCGDGRWLIEAAIMCGCRGFGVDVRPPVLQEARQNAAARGVQHLVQFWEQDFFGADFAFPSDDATVIMVYLLPNVLARLRPVFTRALRTGKVRLVVTYLYDIRKWEPVLYDDRFQTFYYDNSSVR